MSYRNLDAERLMAIVEAMNVIAAAPLDPEEVAEIATSEVKSLTGASRASLEHTYRGAERRVLNGELEGAGESISVPVECRGRQVGLLTVAKDEVDGFSEADVETLRLLGHCVSSLLCNAMTHADVAAESRVDKLTGLGNALAFEERVGWELSRAHRYEEPLSLLMVRIDDLGGMTDRLGVDAADGSISEVGKSLADGRSADSIFRVARDTFAMILPNTPAEGAEIAAMRLGWAVANLHDGERQVTVSTGVFQAVGDDPRAFVAGVEAALRRSVTASVLERPTQSA
jgi:diguanylate cyclase (GGDEF)-like protein